MGFFSTLCELPRRLMGRRTVRSSFSKKPVLRRRRTCRFEEMEARQLLSIVPPIQVGMVYLEDASGKDEAGGDRFEITFQGGSPGTQLTQIVIDTDKLGDGLTIGDCFFDTSSGGNGAYGSAPFAIVGKDGIDSVTASVTDGGSRLVLNFTGFDVGERLVFTIDVDEMGFLGPNAVAEGNEFEGSRLTAKFQAPHFYEASGNDMFIDAYDSKLQASGLSLPNDNYVPPGTEPKPVLTAGAFLPINQTPLPITISGTVYEDVDLDNIHDAGEQGLGGVQLALLRLDGNQYVATGQTVLTQADGSYRFDGVLPGTYRVVETQPTDYFSIGATAGTVGGQTRGTVSTADIITDIALVGGEDSIRNDFAEARPARLSGHVYHDANNNGVRDAGDAGIGGVHLLVRYLPTSGAVPAPIEVITAADGSWSADHLMPGNYSVEEIQPTGYLDGRDTAGTAGGTAHNPGDLIDGFHLVSGQVGENYDFGELIPSTISGRVVADNNANGSFDAGDMPIAGVKIYLRDAAGNKLAETTTDSAGKYSFAGLMPGVYTVEEIQPDGYYDGSDHVGSAGGVLVPPDTISTIAIVSGTQAVEYDFYELKPVSISGYVYADNNQNGVKNGSEPGIAGVVVKLLDANGNPTGKTATTDASGFYKFDNLLPGVYGVSEVQPTGYLDGTDAAGTAGGVADNPGDSITGANLTPGTNGLNYNFGELIPSSISGRVAADNNANGEFDPDDDPLAGVKIYLRDSMGNIVAETTTDSYGEYQFSGLAPGIYSVEEVQPAGYYDGSDHVGNVGGVLVPPDTISTITIMPGTQAVEYDFYELKPVSISGYVYADNNLNGVKNANEPGIAGVAVKLLDASGKPTGLTATTDANGYYKFDNLLPGVYGVSEVQPTGYLDGTDAAGTAGGAAHNPGDLITGANLTPGTNAEQYNFGELIPVSISGMVYADLNNSGTFDSGETPLAGVTIYLLDSSGKRIASTTTNAQGKYQFVNQTPGTYGVEEIQPAGYLDGQDSIGSAGGEFDGNDRIIKVKLIPGTNGVHYDFAELPPAKISGYVFQDGPTITRERGTPAPDPLTLRDGVLHPEDKRLAGVKLTLGDAHGDPILDARGRPIVTYTDANGYYEFNNLTPGIYSVIESHPAGYIDGIDTAGSRGGLAINRLQPVDPLMLAELAVDPRDDAIVFIPIQAGDNATEYNFSEILVKETVKPPPTEPKTFPWGDLPQPQTFYNSPPPPIILNGPTEYTRDFLDGPNGGGMPVEYTWHLSVIDAGRPRQDQENNTSIASADGLFHSVSWSGRELARGQWILADTDGKPQKTYTFGQDGATPVVGDWSGDGITRIGVFSEGTWYCDLDGSGSWGENDLWAQLGSKDDRPVVGDWDGDGKSDIGIFGPVWPGDGRAMKHEAGLPDAKNRRPAHPTVRYKNIPPDPQQTTAGYRTLKRTAQGKFRKDVIDHVFQYGADGDKPIIGDWNGDGVSNIGVFRDGAWYLDADGDGLWSDGDVYAEYGQKGDIPVVGDWTGDGTKKLGVYRNGAWYLDVNGDRKLDERDKVIHLGEKGDIPVVGDWTGDGVDKVGIYRPGAAQSDSQAATEQAPSSESASTEDAGNTEEVAGREAPAVN